MARLWPWLFASLLALSVGTARAALPPKYERLSRLSVALDHLNEVAHLLPEPIERIEYVNDGEVRFVAGKCFVAVTIRARPQNPQEVRVGGSPELEGSVGKLQCNNGR
jgi:hypothetical protein